MDKSVGRVEEFDEVVYNVSFDDFFDWGVVFFVE